MGWKRFLKSYSRELSTKVFYLHVPKCSGTSVKEGLQRTTSPDKMHFLDPVSSKACAKALGARLFDYREHILLYLMASPQLDLIGGHFQWSDKAYELFGDQWAYITILRNPIDKWFSQYFYNRYKTSNHFRIHMDIEQFIDSEEGHRLGCDQVEKLTDPSTPSEKKVDQAIENLERFTLIGITEKLDLFSEEFKKQFGVPLVIPHTNKNPAEKMKIEALSRPQIHKKVEKLCLPDMQLYEKVLKRKNIKVQSLSLF